MKEWIVQNWKLVIEIILVITSLVLCCVRKKPVKVVDTLREVVIRLLPAAINKAEETSLKGDAKAKFALACVEATLKELGYEMTDELNDYARLYLEAILSTPQKKGECDEK